MAFWKKDDKKKEELEDIKNNIKGMENEPLPPPPTMPLVPKPPEKQISPDLAPLFVKIERYKEVLSKLEQ